MCAHVWVCTHVCRTHSIQKRVSDPLNYKHLWLCNMSAGNWTRVLCQSSKKPWSLSYRCSPYTVYLIISIHHYLPSTAPRTSTPPPFQFLVFLFKLLIITPWVQLVLPVCAWVWGHLPAATPPRGESPFHRGHQLPIASLIRVLPQEPSSFHAEIFFTGLTLSRTCVGNCNCHVWKRSREDVYVPLWVYMRCVQCPWGLEGTGSPGSGVRGSCELPHRGPGNQTLVFCKGSKDF